ncbi:MAG TPA: response regulator transcription factor [Thermoanaerobaculia bacterium]
MIRVVLVEDQMLVRLGIRSLLELTEDIRAAGEAADGEEALRVIEETKPDVVLLDMRMPKLDGVGVLRALGERGTFPPTLILTTFDDDELVFEGLRAGAKGFLLKDVSLERLTNAIRQLASGGSFIQPVVTERILRGLVQPQRNREPVAPGDRLTERETEVLRLMAGGYSNREIGAALRVGEGTVKNHISSILAKMGVRDRTRAVLKGLEAGYLD